MPASWADLFERGADYDADLEAVRAAADELSATETAEPAATESAGTEATDDA